MHDLQAQGNRVSFDVDAGALDAVLRQLTSVGVRSLTSQPPTLEELFLRHYDTRPARERRGPVTRGGGAVNQPLDRALTGPETSIRLILRRDRFADAAVGGASSRSSWSST